MTQKKVSKKKLQIKKEVVRELTDKDLANVAGGIGTANCNETDQTKANTCACVSQKCNTGVGC